MHVTVITTVTPDDTAYYARHGLEQQSYDDYDHIVHESTEPLAVARNNAASQAAGDILAFLDGDAEPRPEWVAELVAGFQEGALAVGGPAVPRFSKYSMEVLVPEGWEWLVGCGPYYDDERWVRNTYGCNIALRRDIFDQLGGFDERYGKGAQVPQGEETDLLKRMYDQYDERVRYRPDAVVYHKIRPAQLTVWSLLRRSYRQGVTKGVLGVDEEETSFVRDAATTKSPWQWTLLAAGGLGYLRGRARSIRHQAREPTATQDAPATPDGIHHD